MGIDDAPIKNPSITENSYDSYEKGYYAGIGFNWKFDGGASFLTARIKIARRVTQRECEVCRNIIYWINKVQLLPVSNRLKYNRYCKKSNDYILEKSSCTKLRSQYGLEDIATLVQAYDLHYVSLAQWIDAMRLTNIALTNLYRYTSQLPTRQG